MPTRVSLVAILVTGVVALAAPSTAAAQSGFIPAPGRADMVHDPLRNVLYITAGPDVLRFDLRTRQFLPPFRLGGQLLGVALSLDANTLAAADETYEGTAWARPVVGRLWIHLVDLRSTQVEKVSFARALGEAGTFSVAFGADGAILVTSQLAGSGFTPFRRYDPRTRVTTILPTALPLGTVSQDTMLSATADGNLIAFAESNGSDGGWGVYRVADGRLVHNRGYERGTSSFNIDVAVSRGGDQFAVLARDMMTVLNAQAERLLRRNDPYPPSLPGMPGHLGVAYHPTADVLFVSVTGTTEIRALSTRTFETVGTYRVTGAFGFTFPYYSYRDGRLKVSRDGSLLFASVPGGISYVWLYPTIEDSAPDIRYTGTWRDYGCADCSSSALRASDQTLAQATFSFTGSGIQWVTATGPMLGKANVFVDGVFRGTIDLYSPAMAFQTQYELRGLPLGAHTVIIEVAGQKHAASSGYYVAVDAFRIVP